MKEYQSVEIKLVTIYQDVITESYGEIEQNKAFYDNEEKDIFW